jgi:hypothetical protein
MKRLLLGGIVLSGATFLWGCPIYPDQSTYQYCDSRNQCCSDSDCLSGNYCDSSGLCVADNSYDASTNYGLCGYCEPGTACTLRDGVPQCLGPDQEDGSADFDVTPVGEAGPLDGALGTPLDGGTDSGPVSVPCNSDDACGGNGSKCIDGVCAAQAQLCSDAIQCKVAGESCVDGVCTPTCSSGQATPCPTGYQCDFSRGVCSINPATCSSSLQCQGGTVCVDTRCVAPVVIVGDAGATCPSGQVAVNGGCIPDQAATFACRNNGNQGALASTCEANSICLHSDCYVACGSDGGSCTKPGETCKGVTIESGSSPGTYFVCGTATTLGSECDLAAGVPCGDGKVCIDGYCK